MNDVSIYFLKQALLQINKVELFIMLNRYSGMIFLSLITSSEHGDSDGLVAAPGTNAHLFRLLQRHQWREGHAKTFGAHRRCTCLNIGALGGEFFDLVLAWGLIAEGSLDQVALRKIFEELGPSLKYI